MKNFDSLHSEIQNLYNEQLDEKELQEAGNRLLDFMTVLIEIDREQKNKTKTNNKEVMQNADFRSTDKLNQT